MTLTNEANKIFKALQAVEPEGKINFITGIRIAHVSTKISVKYKYTKCRQYWDRRKTDFCIPSVPTVFTFWGSTEFLATTYLSDFLSCTAVGIEAPPEQESEDEDCGVHRQSCVQRGERGEYTDIL